MKIIKIIFGFIALFLILMASLVGLYAHNNWTDKTSDIVGLIYGAVMIASILIFAIIHVIEDEQ